MRASRDTRWMMRGMLAALLVAGLGAGGCIFSPDNDSGDDQPPPPPPTYEFPSTEQILMENFKTAYGRMDIDGYRDVLHDDYIFKFKQEDVENLGLEYDRWYKDEELEGAQNLFSGQPSPSTGEAGVSGIEWSLLSPVGTWEDSTDPDFPNSERALYNIFLRIERPGTTTIEIQGQQIFYVTSRDSVMGDGTTRPYFQLVGQVDMSQGPTQTKLADGTS
jgi:hypothetical protein